MDSSGLVLLVGGGMVLVFFSLLMWWAIRHERQKAELVHAERRLALERGIPLPDAEVARCRALGWVGVVVPIVALGVGSGVTVLLVPPRATEPSVVGLVAVWAACGVTATGGVVAAAFRLRAGLRSPDAEPGAAADRGRM